MTQWLLRGAGLGLLLSFAATVDAVPIPNEKKGEVIADRANFIPNRKHLPIPGKIIAVLATDAAPVLSTEGRSGPADQLCIGWNGGSYRWVYVPSDGAALINNLQVPVADGSKRVYPRLNMATPTSVKKWDIDKLYSLVEVEVNDGDGSPANDSFVATKMKKLDGSKDYPIQVAAVIADAKKQYDAHLSEKQKDIDTAMEDAAKKALKDRKPNGPREKNTLMFVTWMPDTEKLVVRFLTKITDGDYKYGGGINIEFDPVPLPPGPVQGGPAPPRRLENGLRYGTQFGVEYGAQFEIAKSGKIDKIKSLEPQTFTREMPAPPMIGGPRPRPLPLPVPPVNLPPPPLPVEKN
jgi:hypothetical protein